eukprot:5959033-Prorocentrum_lima.AAC.1
MTSLCPGHGIRSPVRQIRSGQLLRRFSPKVWGRGLNYSTPISTPDIGWELHLQHHAGPPPTQSRILVHTRAPKVHPFAGRKRLLCCWTATV